MTEGASAIAATAGGSLLALPILVPAAGVLLSFLLGGRQAERIALGLMAAQFGVAVAIASLVWRSGEPLVYVLGGYVPPLGIALRADGFSAVMLVTASLIMPAAGLYARVNFTTPSEVSGEAGAAGLLDSDAGDPGGLEPHLSRRRSVQPLCRARASHFRRGASGLSRRPSGDVGRGAALSHVRAVRRALLSARRSVALWGLRHARHRPSRLTVSAPNRRYGSRPG